MYRRILLSVVVVTAITIITITSLSIQYSFGDCGSCGEPSEHASSQPETSTSTEGTTSQSGEERRQGAKDSAGANIDYDTQSDPTVITGSSTGSSNTSQQIKNLEGLFCACDGDGCECQKRDDCEGTRDVTILNDKGGIHDFIEACSKRVMEGDYNVAIVTIPPKKCACDLHYSNQCECLKSGDCDGIRFTFEFEDHKISKTIFHCRQVMEGGTGVAIATPPPKEKPVCSCGMHLCDCQKDSTCLDVARKLRDGTEWICDPERKCDCGGSQCICPQSGDDKCEIEFYLDLRDEVLSKYKDLGGVFSRSEEAQNYRKIIYSYEQKLEKDFQCGEPHKYWRKTRRNKYGVTYERMGLDHRGKIPK